MTGKNELSVVRHTMSRREADGSLRPDRRKRFTGLDFSRVKMCEMKKKPNGFYQRQTVRGSRRQTGVSR